MPKTKMQKCIYGILSVPFVLLQYWKAVLTSALPQKETPKEQKRHCGSFAISIGLLLYLIFTQEAGNFILPTLLMTFMASVSLLEKQKIAKMMGFDRNGLAAGLVFTIIIPLLACLFLYYKGWLWATGLFTILLLTIGAVKLLHIMSQDFCKNHVASFIKKILSDFLLSISEFIQIFRTQRIGNIIYNTSFGQSNYLLCKSVIQKRE